MLIDWFTVGAQALNFLVLVWVLKRFLYKPILDAIDAREKRVAAELADADAKKAEAQAERDEFKRKNEEVDQQRDALLAQAEKDAKTAGRQLLDQARQAADALSAKRQEALQQEAQSLDAAITHRTQTEVFAIARQAMKDLATASLEQRIADVFMRKLREIDVESKDLLAAALKSSSESALVRSAFDLPPEQRSLIQNAINETFSADIHLRFETAPDVISGIELSASGQKVAWSIAEYLTSLEKGVGDLLQQQVKSKVDVEPKPVGPAPATTSP